MVIWHKMSIRYSQCHPTGLHRICRGNHTRIYEPPELSRRQHAALASGRDPGQGESKEQQVGVEIPGKLAGMENSGKKVGVENSGKKVGVEISEIRVGMEI